MTRKQSNRTVDTARSRQVRTGRRRHRDKYNGTASRPERARWHFNDQGTPKKAFNTQAAAERAAAAVIERSGAEMARQGKTIRAYHCQTCSGWHIGKVRIDA